MKHASRRVPWLIVVLGVALALAGAASLASGAPYLRMDWGATEVLAGTVALAGGCITLSLGAVLFALRDLTERGLSMAAGAAVAVAASGFDKPILVAAPTVASTHGSSEAGSTGGDDSMLGMPQDLDEVSYGAEPRDRVERWSERVSVGRPQVHADAPAPAAVEAELPSAELAPTAPEASTIVGRYEANGASYVLFSDGTIEVETATGTHRFASMADLKEHIERQDATG